MRRYLRYLLFAWLVVFAPSAMAQVGKWRDMYKVKKKDTLFGIAKKYGITIPELMTANPEMKAEGYALKKGDFIFIPYPGAPATAASAPAGSQAPAGKDGRQGKSVKVGVMLPLHDADGDGRRMVEYYRGFLMGCDSLRQMGISTDIKAWNVSIDTDIAQVLKDPAAATRDIIIGPLYSHQVRGLAEFCKARNIKMVIPFSINGDDVAAYRQIFQVWESPDKLNNSAIETFLRRFPDAHPVFIDCNDKESKKGIFTFGLRNRLANKNIEYSITNITSSEELFAKAFSKSKRNVVILNTARSPELTVALAKIESLQNNRPSLAITLFGYTEWLMYTGNNLEKFFRFDTYIPASFYYNEVDPKTRGLERSYSRWFRQDMQHALPRFAITGYDHAQFFVRGIDKHGKNFTGGEGQSTYRALQSPLKFKQVGTAGMQNEFFHLIHYTKDGNIESIAY